MTGEKLDDDRIAQIARAEDEAGVVDQQAAAEVASGGSADGAAVPQPDESAGSDAEKAIDLPLEENDFNSQPGS